jgi:CheY-like chemotaxis protein
VLRAHLLRETKPSLPLYSVSPRMKQVLIVDDEYDTRTVLEIILSAEGYETCSACHGLEALKMIEQHAPDLVLTDVMMPVMDGIELCAVLRTRQRTSAIPLVLITASHNVPPQQIWDGYVQKPIDIPQLVETVEALLPVH